MNVDANFMKDESDTNVDTSTNGCGEHINDVNQIEKQHEDSVVQPPTVNRNVNSFDFIRDPFLMTVGRLKGIPNFCKQLPSGNDVTGAAKSDCVNVDKKDLGVGAANKHTNANGVPESIKDHTSQLATLTKLEQWLSMHHSVPMWPVSFNSGSFSFSGIVEEMLLYLFAGPIRKLKSGTGPKVDDIATEPADGVNLVQSEGIQKMLPVTLDSVHFKGGTLMLLAYGDREPRMMENVNGHVKFQNHYGRVFVQLSGNCKMWRSDQMSEDGGWLSADVFVDTVEQKWHANLKMANLFVPLFERILEIPITWLKGRATGPFVHVKG